MLSLTTIRGHEGSVIKIDKSARIKRSKITVKPGSELTIGKGFRLKNVRLVVNGKMTIGDNNIINSEYNTGRLFVLVDGIFDAGRCNRINSTIKIRFGGHLTVGNYTNINKESEIRIDERVDIGSYNRISYNVMIWDTNTHNIYPAERRRQLTEEKFPAFGYEYEKPNR